MQSFSGGGGVDLDRFLAELRIPHELDLALSRPDENYQRLKSCNREQDPAAAAGPPPPKKSAHPSRHHQELLRRLNSSHDFPDFGSHKQDLSIVKFPKPDNDENRSDGDKMLNEYMERIQVLEDKKRKVKVGTEASGGGRGVSRSASTDNVLANEFMVARQRFNLSNVEEAEAEGGEGGVRRYGNARRGRNAAEQNGGGGQFLTVSINSTSRSAKKYKRFFYYILTLAFCLIITCQCLLSNHEILPSFQVSNVIFRTTFSRVGN